MGYLPIEPPGTTEEQRKEHRRYVRFQVFAMTAIYILAYLLLMLCVFHHYFLQY